MKSSYVFCIRPNYAGELTIEFNHIVHTTEFLKMLLQLLGMYNFMLKTNQNIGQNSLILAELIAPNGKVTLHIDSEKRISLSGNKNQIDISKIKEILNRLVVFKKEELETKICC